MNAREGTAGVALATDIGGTHARIAVVEQEGEKLTLSRFRKYRCADFESLADILSHYCEETGCGMPVSLGVAVAGTVINGHVHASNMPWDYRFEQLSERFTGVHVFVLNDYHAVAIGTQFLEPNEYFPLTTGLPVPGGLAIALGVGTGLGGAIRSGAGDTLRVFPTELGQTRLGAYRGLDFEVLGLLAEPNGFVRLERILSGPGIAATYNAVRTVLGLSACELEPSDVVTRANEGEQTACATLQLVASVLANLLSNLAVMLRPDGGIFLSGGVTPRLEPFLRTPAFHAALTANEPMQERIRDVPIMIVRRDDIGVLGAARWMQHETRRTAIENP